MIQLESTHRSDAVAAYRNHEYYFPLMGAVLSDLQDGVVYTDDFDSPTGYYIEHKFGFAQIFGNISAAFERDLRKYLLEDKSFAVSKIRLYAPVEFDFMALPAMQAVKSYRQRLFLRKDTVSDLPPESIVIRRGLLSDAEKLDALFGVVSRFWRSPSDFINYGLPALAIHGDTPVAVCYAAAVADKTAEVDVATLPEFRNRGLGKLVGRRFVQQCAEVGVEVRWDCFANNAGSMALGQSIGFVAPNPPYSFFTIAK